MMVDPSFLNRQNQPLRRLRAPYGFDKPRTKTHTDRYFREFSERLIVLTGWSDRCAYCCVPLDDTTVTIDHVVPKSRGGPESLENLVPACQRCNVAKGDGTPGEFLAHKGFCEHKVLEWYEAYRDANVIRALSLSNCYLSFSSHQRDKLGLTQFSLHVMKSL